MEERRNSLTPEELASGQWEIRDGRKIPMQYHNLKLSSEEIAFIALIMSSMIMYQDFKYPLHELTHRDRMLIQQIMNATEIMHMPTGA